jgi:fumarate hydratase subunit alpha
MTMNVDTTKIIHFDTIREKVKSLCMEANYFLGEDIKIYIEKAIEKESSPLGKEVLKDLQRNWELAAKEQIPICQDTGTAVIFLEIGQEVKIVGGYLYDAINEGVRKGYREGYLRKSMVKHPWLRVNTDDNTPAIIHTEIVPGNKLKITVAPKGGGSENMSALKMLTPAAGLEGVKRFVLESVKKAGPNACPPLVVGVGVGGNFEKAALLAKKALLRKLGHFNQDPAIAQVELELLKDINKTGIGPQGFGGNTTALAVNIEVFPCHIASLPVAVNINCHASRHKTIIL